MGFGGSIGHAFHKAAKKVAEKSPAKKVVEKAVHSSVGEKITSTAVGAATKADSKLQHYGSKATRVAVPVAAVAINYVSAGAAAGLTSRVIASNKSLGGGSTLAAIGNMFTNFTTAFGGLSNAAVGAATGDAKLDLSSGAGLASAGASAAGYGGAATALDFAAAATKKSPKAPKAYVAPVTSKVKAPGAPRSATAASSPFTPSLAVAAVVAVAVGIFLVAK